MFRCCLLLCLWIYLCLPNVLCDIPNNDIQLVNKRHVQPNDLEFFNQGSRSSLSYLYEKRDNEDQEEFEIQSKKHKPNSHKHKHQHQHQHSKSHSKKYKTKKKVKITTTTITTTSQTTDFASQEIQIIDEGKEGWQLNAGLYFDKDIHSGKDDHSSDSDDEKGKKFWIFADDSYDGIKKVSPDEDNITFLSFNQTFIRMKLVLLFWLNLAFSLAKTGTDKVKIQENDVKDLVYFNQVFDMVDQQAPPPGQNLTFSVNENNSTIPLITIIKPGNNDTSQIDVNSKKKKGKLKPKWEYNAGVYFEKKINKKLMKKQKKKKGGGRFGILANEENSLVLGSSEKLLVPTELMVSRALPDTHNLFSQNLTDYSGTKTKIKLKQSNSPQVDVSEPSSTSYTYFDLSKEVYSESSFGNSFIKPFWMTFWWTFLYIL
ncbi:PGA19 Predicted GPI-anchored protein 19 [Candida maltosa Xu316]